MAKDAFISGSYVGRGKPSKRAYGLPYAAGGALKTRRSVWLGAAAAAIPKRIRLVDIAERYAKNRREQHVTPPGELGLVGN
jgi:hypothetical protein